MAISCFRHDPVRLISDGDKVAVLVNDWEIPICYLLKNSHLDKFEITKHRNIYSHGLTGKKIPPAPLPPLITIDLTLICSGVDIIDKPLVMGVDIFDKLSVTDYLDIINEKIKAR